MSDFQVGKRPGRSGLLRYCPYDGAKLTPRKDQYCRLCQKTITLQNAAPKKPRNFYEKMPEGISDNYTDETFLKGLASKNSFPELRYSTMVRATSEVINVLSTLSCLITTFFYLDKSSENGVVVCIGTIVLICVCFAMHLWLNKDKLNCGVISDSIGGFLFLTGILAFLTPVLQSLTINVSSDTVWFLVITFIVIHLWAYDYDTSPKQTAIIAPIIVRSPTSLNAIFLAAILLASRLEGFVSVFLLLFQSFLLFGFGPFFRMELRQHSQRLNECFTVGWTLFLFALTFKLNKLAGCLYLSASFLIVFGGPMLFIYAYSFKNDIRGAWDLPKVQSIQHLK